MARKQNVEMDRLRDQNRQLQSRVAILESKMQEGKREKTSGALHSFIASPWLQVFGVLVALGVALSGRLDSAGTTACLVLAGLVAAIGLLCHVKRKLVTVSLCAAIVIGLWWLNGYLLEKTGVITAKQGEQLTAVLKTAIAPEFVKIACPDAEENVCIYANSFIPRFQRAGWKVAEVDGKPTLERVRLGRPTAAVIIVHHGPPLVNPQDPDHGVWTKLSPLDQVLKTAFNLIGIEVEMTNDPELPETMIRVYFGAVPKR